MVQNNIEGQSEVKSQPESLRLIRECPLCKKEYNLNDAQVVDEVNNTHLVHATCPHCRSAMLSVVVLSQSGMSSVGVFTDLAVDDLKRIKNKGSISEDELLEFHSNIRKKNFLKFNLTN
jgi:hypothetical protein